MGARIAIRAAAIDQNQNRIIRALVVEDMDLRVRNGPNPPHDQLDKLKKEQLSTWLDDANPRGGPGRWFPSWETCREKLLDWYDDTKRVDSWRDKRVRPTPNNDGYWSDVSPLVQRLARECVLASKDASQAWDLLAHGGLPIHVWYADPRHSVVAVDGDDGVQDMLHRVKQAQARVFTGASHSIHTSMTSEYVDALCEVIDAAASSDMSPDMLKRWEQVHD